MKNDEELPGMLAVAKGIAEQRFPHTMDAAVWAAEFVKLHPDADEGAMIGWFANAIMAGYDTARSRVGTSSEKKRKLSELLPTTWLDPLLSGPDALIPCTRTIVGTDIENLLRALKKRIEDAEAEHG